MFAKRKFIIIFAYMIIHSYEEGLLLVLKYSGENYLRN